MIIAAVNCRRPSGQINFFRRDSVRGPRPCRLCPVPATQEIDFNTISDGAFANFDYLSTWTSIAQDVRDAVMRELKDRPRDEIVRVVEQAAVVNSVSNLMTFPWIAERVAAGTLVLHAWWFNLIEGQLYAFNPSSAVFAPVLGVQLEAAVAKGTPFSATKPERFIAAVAGRRPTF